MTAKIIACALVTMFAAHNVSAEPVVSISTQLLEIPGDIRMPENIAQLPPVGDDDRVSIPDQKTAPGEPVTVSVSRSFQVEGKGTFPVGLFLTIHASLDGEGVLYSVDFERTEFVAFAERSATQAPIFDIRKINGLDGRCENGGTVVLDLGRREDTQTVPEAGKVAGTKAIQKRLIAVLTFNKV